MHITEFSATPGFKIILNDWAIEVLGSFGPNGNFIEIDHYSMFEAMSATLMRGFSSHAKEESRPFYLLDVPSGNRIRIYPPGTWKREDFDICPDCANSDFVFKDNKERACDNVLYHTT